MKYTEKEQLQKILSRGDKLRQRKDRRKLKGLSLSAVALLCVLVAFIGAFGRTGYAQSRTVYGSFMLSAETGGYVLVAVVFFALGATVVLLCKRLKKRKKLNKEGRKLDE